MVVSNATAPIIFARLERLDLLQHVKPLLDRMLAHHFRLSRRVYEEFLVQVDESPDGSA